MHSLGKMIGLTKVLDKVTWMSFLGNQLQAVHEAGAKFQVLDTAFSGSDGDRLNLK